MDGGDGPAVQLGNIPQVLHPREMPSGNGDRRLLDLTGPPGDDPVAAGRQGEHADAVKEAAQSQRTAVRRFAVVRLFLQFFHGSNLSRLGTPVSAPPRPPVWWT